MKFKTTLILSSVLALGAISASIAQDATPRPAAPAAAPEGAPRRGPLGGGAGGAQQGERAPPSLGGTVGTVDSVSATGFAVTTSVGRKATVETSASTIYRKGKSSAAASAVKAGERVMVIGLVKVGMGEENGTANIKADKVVVQPIGLDKATNVEAGGGQQGAPPVAKEVGKVPGNYVQGEGTIIVGEEATKAIEAAMTGYTGGMINRVVKLSTGEYEVHNVASRWPHHIFVSKDFKYMGAQ
jgi:hypothetical protein